MIDLSSFVLRVDSSYNRMWMLYDKKNPCSLLALLLYALVNAPVLTNPLLVQVCINCSTL